VFGSKVGLDVAVQRHGYTCICKMGLHGCMVAWVYWGEGGGYTVNVHTDLAVFQRGVWRATPGFNVNALTT
jgi:hypothetical protein